MGTRKTFAKFETARGDGTVAVYVDMDEVCAVETRGDGATDLILRSGKVIVVTNPGLAPGVNWPEDANVVTPKVADDVDDGSGK